MAVPVVSGRHIRFLADQNFREPIVQGLRRRQPAIEIVLLRDVELQHSPDPDIIVFASRAGLMILTHDKRTMPDYLDEFMRNLPPGAHASGGFVIPQSMSTGAAIDELLLIWEASDPEEWQDRFTYLPL